MGLTLKRRPRYAGRPRPERIDISKTVELTKEEICQMSRFELIERLIDAYWIAQSKDCDLDEANKALMGGLSEKDLQVMSIEDLRMHLLRAVTLLNSTSWIAGMRFAFRDH